MTCLGTEPGKKAFMLVRLAGLILILLMAALTLAQNEPGGMLELHGSIRQVHDPVLISEAGRYYLYSTGTGIPVRCSDDMLTWELCSMVFSQLPDWARTYVPGVTQVWAPDISFFSGRYHLYYSLSTFGSNVSAIGLATNSTLDPNSPEYGWVDEGVVISSSRANDWNAIDPNFIQAEDGSSWLAFGSFWSGIKMIRLDPETGKQSEKDKMLYALASRPEAPRAVEAPFITYRDGYYYLFVSFDACCRAAESTYNIRVGRSQEVTGPYLARDGTPMLEGGGTLVLEGSERWRGPGHNAIFRDEEGYKLIYHAYDAEFVGTPTLRIERLEWDNEGWPVAPSGRELESSSG